MAWRKISTAFIAIVEDPSPMKRGLKVDVHRHAMQVDAAVEDPSPMKRGLKALGAACCQNGKQS